MYGIDAADGHDFETEDLQLLIQRDRDELLLGFVLQVFEQVDDLAGAFDRFANRGPVLDSLLAVGDLHFAQVGWGG